MSQLKQTKINKLLTKWPAGAVFTSSWLHKRGYGYDLLKKYRGSGWIRSLGDGAGARAGDNIDWTGGLHAIQKQLELPVHAAAKTALQLEGYVHFLPLGRGEVVSLFGHRNVALPLWFSRYDWGVKLRYTTTNLFSSKEDVGLTTAQRGSYSITISAPERAILELLYLVPQKESFEGAAVLMESLSALRPDLLQTLLNYCGSIKTKRLFLFLAERNNHPWFKKIKASKVNLGEGNRLIVSRGRFDAKYKITVPKEFGVKDESPEKP